MDLKSTVVLLIGDGRTEATVREALADAQGTLFTVECSSGLVEGLDRLAKRGISAVLLDLNALGHPGLPNLDRVWQAAPHIPILLIGAPNGDDLAKQAVTLGAEYLPTTRIDSYSLPHALRHVIERKAAEEVLFFERQRAEVTLKSIGDAVLGSDALGIVTYLNPVAERLLGWSHEEAVGRPLVDVFRIVDAATRDSARNPMEAAIQLDTMVGLTPNCLLIRRDGSEIAIEDSASPIHDRGGQVIGAVMVFHDVSVARALAVRATHLAQHDFMTDLPNRMLLHDRITQAIASVRRRGNRIAVLFLDLDRFKHVNDSLGHVVGDALLQCVARRLETCVRSSDTVSRQGGDEFVVLLSDIDHADDAAAGAQKVLATLVTPIDVASHQLHVTTTIGISLLDDGTDAATLIQCADTAMYHAKQHGHHTDEFFAREMNARALERQHIEAGLHRALARHELESITSPKIDLETGAITGAEALLLWVHPDRGLLPPKDFMPIAEDCGLIVPIGQWVLREACRQARFWMDQGHGPMPVAVNISSIEFRDPRFVDNVRTIVNESGLDPRHLELELTETVLMQHPQSTAIALDALKEMGVRLAIDDFGTGYSSLNYLRLFPADVLKIDQSFVHEITADPISAPIVRAVISMGKSLGHRVIAEGWKRLSSSRF